MDQPKPNISRREGQTAVVAVDLGATNVRVALVSRELHILRRHKEPSRSATGAMAILDRLGLIVQELLHTSSVTVRGVGFCLAGTVDAHGGIVHRCPNLPGWDGMHLRADLEKRLKLPVVIGNDGNLGALGEARALSRMPDCLLYVAVGTGVGGGVVSKGKAYLGGRGLGPEVGHIVVQADPSLPRAWPRACGPVVARSSGLSSVASPSYGLLD